MFEIQAAVALHASAPAPRSRRAAVQAATPDTTDERVDLLASIAKRAAHCAAVPPAAAASTHGHRASSSAPSAPPS
ncbi:MAG: ammonia channel protein, partial [Burkholderiaceae bacterium]|nr:ammonia channel protein [Burkholderiaceae bacterium]